MPCDSRAAATPKSLPAATRAFAVFAKLKSAHGMAGGIDRWSRDAAGTERKFGMIKKHLAEQGAVPRDDHGYAQR